MAQKPICKIAIQGCLQLIELFNFSLEQVKEAGWALIAYTYDLHHQEEMNEGNIMTEYEQKFSEKGNPINKLIAQRK